MPARDVYMDSLEKDRAAIERVLCECAQFYATKDARTLNVFDRVRDQYLLLDEGCDGFKRIHTTWVHVELRDGLFWIQKDGTLDGIAVELIKSGISKERIVLAFKHPSRRFDTDFAFA